MRILAQLEGRANGTDIPQSLTIPTFTPTLSDVCVNVLWFLSLIFSLATVLIGIIALQWLREHLRPHTDLEPQIAFSLHHLNVESLDRWYLPQIFTALPLLLQLALVLFLTGILEFLRSLNSTVAIPVAVAVGSILFFLSWTTILPAVQALSLFLPRWSSGNMPRSPCPYRSPQSWAFHQSVRPLIAILLSTFGDTDIDKPNQSWDYRGLVSNSMTLKKDRRLVLEETTSRRQQRPSNLIFRPGSVNSWAELGVAWLFQRDLDSMEQNPWFTKKTGIDEKFRPVPIYDAVQAIISIGGNGSSRDNLLAHHCIQPIVQCNNTDASYMWYLSHLATDLDLDEARAEAFSIDALTHYATLFFHSKIGAGEVDDIRNFVAELFVNITRAMFANGPICLDNIWGVRSSPLNYCEIDALPGMCLFDLIANLYIISGTLDGQEQLLDILQNYFRNAATYYPDTAAAGSTTYFSKVGMKFTMMSALIVCKLKPTSSIFSRHVDLLHSLASGLRAHHDDLEAGPSPDYLFFASFTYAYRLLTDGSDTITTETGQDLILAILHYRERCIPREDMEHSFYNSPGRWTFGSHWGNFIRHIGRLGIVVPPNTQGPPSDRPLLERRPEIQEEPAQPSGDTVVEVLDHRHASIRPSSKTDDG